MGKKGASEVVATLLLIMIAVMVISILVYFIWSYLGDKEEEAGLLQDLSEEDLSIYNADLPAQGTYFTLTLKKGPGGQVEVRRDPAKDAAIVLVSDVSGSMEYCENKKEIDSRLNMWENLTDYFCGYRHSYISGCPVGKKKKIDSLIEATKAFLTEMEGADKIEIGLIEYSSGERVEKVKGSDLSVKLYAGTSSPGACYEPGWMNKTLSEISWVNWAPGMNVANNNAKVYFRKHFNIPSQESLDRIKLLNLSLAYKEGIVCFLNEKEVYYYENRTNKAVRWNKSDIIVPVNILDVGDNVLACSVSSDSAGWGFDADLKVINDTGNSYAVHYSISAPLLWKTRIHSNCGSKVNPKYTKALRSTEVDISLFATIKNIGEPITGAFDVSFYNESSAGLVLLGTVTINGIESGEVKNISLILKDTIPENFRNYTVVIDEANLITETDKTNNKDIRSVETYTIFVPTPYININGTIQDVTRCGSGLNTYTIKILLTNYGNTASGTFTVKVYDQNNIEIGSRLVASLNAFASRTEDFIWTTSLPSDVIISSFVDSENVVAENDETDNHDTEIINLIYPNLVPSLALANPVCSLSETDVDVQVTATNTICASGPSDVAASTSINTWNGNIIDIPGLAKDGTASQIFNDLPITLVSFDTPFTVYAGVDAKGQVAELTTVPNHEQDNNITSTFYAGPNLIAYSLIALPNPVETGVGTSITLTGTFTNNQCSANNFNVTLYHDSVTPGNEICNQTFSFTQAGSQQIICVWNTALFQATDVKMFVDSGDVIDESNEGDNQNTITINVVKPDLSLNSLTVQPASVEPNRGYTFSIKSQIKYANLLNSKTFTATVYHDSITPGNEICAQTFTLTGSSTIDINTCTYSSSIISPATFKNIIIFVDSGLDVTESNEGNNKRTTRINVCSGSNLKIDTLTVSPNRVDSGETYDFNINTQFTNSVCELNNVMVTLYHNSIASGNEICSQSFNFAPGLQTQTLSCPWTAQLTTNTDVYAFVDSSNIITESNKADNKASATIEVEGGIYSFSILPLPNLKNFLFSFFVDECNGEAYDLFIPDKNIVRNYSLTSDFGDLAEFVEDAESWWGTCICCGIQNATKMLTQSGKDNKVIVLMSDGKADRPCPDGTTAELAAQAAFSAGIDNITTVAFGTDADVTALQQIAAIGHGDFYNTVDTAGLITAYKKIAHSMKAYYKPTVFYEYIKVVAYAKGTSFSATIDYEDIPAPLETSLPISFNIVALGWKFNGVDITNDDITRIELYAVAKTQGGKEVISPVPISVWVRPSEY